MREYEDKNVFFLYTLGGDQDVPIIHYKKHYRFSCPVIADNLDSLRHIVRVRGMDNVAIFGADGVCVDNRSSFGDDDAAFRKVIDDTLKKAGRAPRKKPCFVERGTIYPAAVRKQGPLTHERMPALCATDDERLLLVYVSDEGGTNDVMLKIRDARGRWGKPIPVAATDADEYAPVITATKKGGAVIAWVSDVGDKRYEIYSSVLKGEKPGKPVRVTKSPDDAMAPSLAFDGKSVWLTWYEWRKMGDLSRDREVFVTKGSGKSWGKRVQVSPTDVPTYEDHSDPVVAPDGKGGAWVAWVWDYHGTLRSKPPVDENSVFLRRVDGRMKLGDVLAPGFRGEGRARDYAPAIAVAEDGVPWIAWDNCHKASVGHSGKAIFVNRLAGKDFGEQFEGAANRGPVCTPRLLVDPENGLRLMWARRDSSGWGIRMRGIAPDGPGKESPVKVPGKSPRYPSAAWDAKGGLHVAWVETEGKRWKVEVSAVK